MNINKNRIIPHRITILGIARSGIAAAKLALSHGAEVFISDSCPNDRMDFILASNGLSHVAHEAAGHTKRVLESDLIVLSPGIPKSIPIVQQARAKGVAVWSEIELAYRFAKAPFLAVTGSTGKSTTVSLLGAILQTAQLPSVVAGNIGLPLSAVVESIPENGFIVAEVSSFQLETIDRFRPHAAAVLNLFKNHLDRYESEEHYYNAKKELTRNMQSSDTLVLNSQDSRLRKWAQELGSRVDVVLFGGRSKEYTCFWHDGKKMWRNAGGISEQIVSLSEMKLAGKHNYDNACAAAALAWAAGLSKAQIARGLSSFSGLAHRLEYVACIENVRYFNDSKATTAESVISAVSAFENNVIVIAGGKDKGCDFAAARNAIARHVKCAVLIGEAAGRIAREWKGATEVKQAHTLEEAVAVASSCAQSGDVVVMSPGCSSFDMFSSYEQRGEEFIKSVKNLNKRDPGGKKA